jgi:hypothetical protein
MNDIIDKINNSNLPFFHNLGERIFYDSELDKVIISICDESITEDIANQYEKFCDDNDIKVDSTLVLHSNMSLKRKYSYSFDFFFIECKRLLNIESDYGIVNYDTEKTMIYNCLSHSANKHRTFIFDGLRERTLLKYGFISYVERGVYLPTNIEERKTESSEWRWTTLVPSIVSKSYFNVVTETHNEIEKHFDDLFITEKTCKALITQPFIIVGNYGTLKYVRERGFETYPELFDESYDLIDNPQLRLNFILNEVEKVCNMDKNELEEIYKSVLWKVEHNRKVMLDFKNDEFASKYVRNWKY